MSPSPAPRRRVLRAAAATAGVTTVALAASLLTGSTEIARAADGTDGTDPAQTDRSAGPGFAAPRVTAGPEAPWMRTSLTPRQRTEALLARMTLVEKVDMVTGDLNNYYGFYNAPIQRLGIPALTMADGPAGVRIADPGVNDKQSTALPAPIALAATFDPSLAREYGDVAGQEASSTRHNVLLAPSVDVARTPYSGRTMEALGEDPLLAERLAVPEIKAVQKYHVAATIKHLAAYNQEADRFSVDARVDERALQEIYLPAFDAAINKGGVAAAMCSFNSLNGEPTCESEELLSTILREQMGFDGLLMSDYGATQTLQGAFDAGLDQEMPGVRTPNGDGGAGAVWGSNLVAAVRDGDVAEADLDEKVRHVLLPMFRIGLFEYQPGVSPLPEQEHAAVARRISAAAHVLLRNRQGALPLRPRDLDSVAVIGADASSAPAAGAGSSKVLPTSTVSPVAGLRSALAGKARVRFAPGTDGVQSADVLPGLDGIPSSFVTPGDGSGTGWSARYWDNPGADGAPDVERTDQRVEFNLGFLANEGFQANSPAVPFLGSNLAGYSGLAATFEGTVTAPRTGTYELGLTGSGLSTLKVDGDEVLVADPDSGTEYATSTVELDLVAGEDYDLEVDYAYDPGQDVADAAVRLGWSTPGPVVPASVTRAADLAAASDVAVVVVRTFEGEGADRRTLALPKGQDQLIRQVTAANPDTIVVVNSGGTITMPWAGRTDAIVQAWFPGQEGGNALADVLLGEVDPGGRLPVTVPRSETAQPVSTEAQYPGVDEVAQYSEGIDVGYRGYAARGIDPRFAFGHGLSYTTFDYRGLRTTPASSAKAATVSFVVTNTGDRTGTAVPQVYVGALPGIPVRSAATALAGFRSLELEPGESTRVTLTVPRRVVSYWDVDDDRFVSAVGSVPVRVAEAVDDTELRGRFQVR